MTAAPLTADQLDALQNWGNGLLREGGTEELRAAGRAIAMLIDELARVQRDRWHERFATNGSAPADEQGLFRENGRAARSPQPV